MRNAAWGRRGVLAAAWWAGLGAVTACGPNGPSTPPSSRTPSPEAEAEQAVAADGMPIIRTDHVRSRHRGTDVRLLTAIPSDADAENLPMVLYLHGRDGMDPTPIPYDTLAALEREHRGGAIPAFGFVAVDGGYNPYWYDGSPNGDLSSMLLHEIPHWLAERGFGHDEGLPFACAGISTGGFGAARYAIERTRAGAPVFAAGLLAPALAVTWDQMREKNAFSSEQQWRAADPLQHLSDLGDVSVGAWVGDADAFKDGTTRLVEEHENTPVFSVLPGAHDAAVFDVVGTDMVRFLGTGVSTLG